MRTHSTSNPLKSHLLLIPMLLATTIAMGDTVLRSSSPVQRADGHAQAAALLSRPQQAGASSPDTALSSRSPAAAATDAHALAAALLSRPQTDTAAKAAAPSKGLSRTLSSGDGHARAAALLSRPRTS